MISKEQVETWDNSYLWHPFTQMQEHVKNKPLIITEGNGILLKDIDGNEYIDGVSSMWCNLLGHRNTRIDNAIKEQLDKVAHTTLLGPTSVPATTLAKELVEIAPEGISKVFFSDNGSTAMEIAIKIAFQYWQQKGNEFKSKTKFIAFENAYHGDTIGAISIGGVELFHNLFKPLLFESSFVPTPHCYRCPEGKDESKCSMECLNRLEELLESNSSETAAVVMEPLVQGAGGMITHPHGFLAGARELCDKYNVLLILDEVLTGFGRTGQMFGCLHENVRPDIMAVAKGINGGYIPLAATLSTNEIYNGFLGQNEEKKTFYHGHTYTGNPLACVAALATLKIIKDDEILKSLEPKIELLTKRLKDLETLKHVGNIRQCGLIAGIELVKERETKTSYDFSEKIGIKVCNEARKRGLLIRPLGDVIVIMPPLIISESDINRMLDIIKDMIMLITSDNAN